MNQLVLRDQKWRKQKIQTKTRRLFSKYPMHRHTRRIIQHLPKFRQRKLKTLRVKENIHRTVVSIQFLNQVVKRLSQTSFNILITTKDFIIRLRITCFQNNKMNNKVIINNSNNNMDISTTVFTEPISRTTC